MIRGALVAPAAALLRAAVRGALALPAALGARSPARRPARGAAAAALESLTEYPIYLLAWIAWAADWIPRLPAIALAAAGRLPPAVIEARPVVLLGPDTDPAPALARARVMGFEAAALLEPHGMTLSLDDPMPALRSETPRPPRCAPSALFGRFFGWASARGSARALTVYLVEDLGAVAGCSFPGADWIVVDLRTDGSTLVHELGHLADLWRHSKDPGNVMTDRPGGSHDRLTRAQAAMIRSSRFARAGGFASARVGRGDSNRDGGGVPHGAERRLDRGGDSK
jgi:hypothetical protein